MPELVIEEAKKFIDVVKKMIKHGLFPASA